MKGCNLKGEREREKKQRKVERQKINHDKIILELSCAKMKRSLKSHVFQNWLKQHLKSSKSEKVKAIVRHSCLRQNSLRRAGQPTLRNARILIQNDNRASADSSETDESDNGV